MNLRLLWVLLTIAAVAYWPVIHGTYLMNWDDNHQIVNNPDVTNLNWESFKHFFTNFYIRSYQPLASLSYSIEYAIFGNNPMVPHFTNYLLHLLNIVLVMRFLSRLLPDRGQLVLLTTAVFALNPIQVETVAWISTRSTLLFSGLFIISCEIYLCYLAEQKRKWLSLCGVTFLLGLLCKSAMLTLPAVLALFDFYKKRKITRATVLEKIPFALLSVIFAIVNMASRDFTLEIKSEFDQYYSITQRLCLGAYSFLFYIGKALVPISLQK